MTSLLTPLLCDIETALLSLTTRLHQGDLRGFQAAVGRLCEGGLSPVPHLLRLSPWIEVMEGLHRAHHADPPP